MQSNLKGSSVHLLTKILTGKPHINGAAKEMTRNITVGIMWITYFSKDRFINLESSFCLGSISTTQAVSCSSSWCCMWACFVNWTIVSETTFLGANRLDIDRFSASEDAPVVEKRPSTGSEPSWFLVDVPSFVFSTTNIASHWLVGLIWTSPVTLNSKQSPLKSRTWLISPPFTRYWYDLRDFCYQVKGINIVMELKCFFAAG